MTPDEQNAYQRQRRAIRGPEYRATANAYRARNRQRVRDHANAWRARVRRPTVYIMYVGLTPVYIGRCANFTERLNYHRQHATWWTTITRTTKRHCASWANSLVLEALFIRKYQPQHNMVGVTA